MELYINRSFSRLNSHTAKVHITYNVKASTNFPCDYESCVVNLKMEKYSFLGDLISGFPHCNGRRDNGCRTSIVSDLERYIKSNGCIKSRGIESARKIMKSNHGS